MWDSLLNLIKYRIFGVFINLYYKIYYSIKIQHIRNISKPIKFVYVLSDLAIWKTEVLYLTMKEDKRFNPILAVTTNVNLKNNDTLIEYLEQKKYSYIVLDIDRTIVQQIQADVILYQRPYNEEPYKHQYAQNKKILLVHIPYGFRCLAEEWIINNYIKLNSWQDYFENDLTASINKKMAANHGKNIVITGIPIMDSLFINKSKFHDQWTNNDNKKRIIWAPHHTIGDLHNIGIAYGNFLEYAEAMVELAIEYKDRVHFAFKPHPILFGNLVKVWGKEKTENYYQLWTEMPNTQLEMGEYVGLFKHSDAMVHDCSSFMVEYLATGNPVMFIIRNSFTTDNLNDCAKYAFDNHYHGRSIDDIRKFVDNVISGVDPQKNNRIAFVNQYLRSPHGKSACENIMNAILGVGEYKKC